MVLGVSGGFGERFIGRQPLPHADDIVTAETETLVEGDDRLVGGANEQIDFGTTAFAEKPLGVFHDLASIAGLLVLRRDGQVIDPAAMPS